MVGSIQGAYIPSVVSELLPNQAVASEAFTLQTSRKASEEAVSLSISPNVQLLAQLKGEFLPPAAVENTSDFLQDSGKAKKDTDKAKSKLKSSYSKKDSTKTGAGWEQMINALTAGVASSASVSSEPVDASASSTEMGAWMELAGGGAHKFPPVVSKSSLISHYKDLSFHVSTGYMVNITA